MVSYIWAFLIIIGIIFSFLTGNVEALNNTILSSSKDAFTIIWGLFPTIILWSGIMKIAENSGLLKNFSSFLYPILKRLFPSVKKESKALGYISSNIAANMLGLGSAATPFGLKAMEELQKENNDKEKASDAMITFLVLNTGGVTIIPTTIIALRLAYNSASPTSIILPSIISTFSSCLSAILIDYLIRRKHK